MPGTYRVLAVSPDGAAGDSGPIELRGNNIGGIRVNLDPADHAAHGVVLDVGGGEVTGAQVTFERLGRVVLAASSDRGGFIARLSPGDHRMTVRAEGYLTHRRGVRVGGPVDLTVELQPASLIAGRVVRADTRQSVPGALVEAHVGTRVIATTTSGDEGVFQLEGFEPGRYQLVARHAGMIGYQSSTVQLGAATAATSLELELELRNGVGLDVQIEDEAGNAIDGARVRRTSRADPVPEMRAATAGRARFEGLLAGEHQLEVRAPRFAIGRRAVLVGDDRAMVAMVLVPESILRGIVVDASGRSVGGAVVSSLAWDPAIGTTSDEHGTFVLRGLPAGEVQLRARHETHGRSDMQAPTLIPGAESTVTLRFSGTAEIHGQVRWSDGQPASGVTVVGASAAGDWKAVAAADGTFGLRHLQPGQMTLTASTDGTFSLGVVHAVPWQQQLDLALGAIVREIDLEIERGAQTIAGVVTDSDGAPVPGVGVRAEMLVLGNFVPGGATVPGYTGEDGSFLLRGLSPGTYRLEVTSPSHAPATLEAKAGETDIRVHLADPGRLTGRVVREGKAVPHFTLFATQSTSTERYAFFDPSGRFELAGLADGAYRIVVSGNDGGSAVLESVQIVEGQTRHIDLHLEAGVEVRGRAISQSGKPIEGAVVTLFVPWERQSSVTNAGGAFEFKDVPRMHLALQARHGSATAFQMVSTVGGSLIAVQDVVLHSQ